MAPVFRRIPMRLNYAGSFGPSNCFEASVSSKLGEHVFDVILNRRSTDVEFICDGSRGVTPC